MAKLAGRWVAKLVGRWVAKLVGRWVAKFVGRWVAKLVWLKFKVHDTGDPWAQKVCILKKNK